jgi:hypothetical protein
MITNQSENPPAGGEQAQGQPTVETFGVVAKDDPVFACLQRDCSERLPE